MINADAASSGGATRRRRVSAYIVLILLLGVTVALGMAAYRPKRVVEVALVPSHLDGVRLFSTQTVVQPDGHGVVVVDLVGVVDGETDRQLRMRIKPTGPRPWYDQPCCDVANRELLGSFQLGAQDAPLVKNETYLFVIEGRDNGREFAAGAISAKVTSLAGLEQWSTAAISLIGLLAAVLQLWQLVPRRTTD